MIVLQFHSEQSFVDNLSKTIYDPRPIKIKACRSFVSYGIEAGSSYKSILSLIEPMSTQGLKQRMSRGYPFKVMLFSYIAVR